ncbi:MAG: hypothetical protein LQ351_006588 [Letrouitia transgressa]|nr:MAG: hypothetical protein LQ351_006588 [Letrouitia transgressa]
MAQQAIPPTPRITSPTPAPAESTEKQDGYFAPITRPSKQSNSPSFAEDRARARSRSPKSLVNSAKSAGLTSPPPASPKPTSKPKSPPPPTPQQRPQPNGVISNGHLSPSSAASPTSSYWRSISRSPSPLGLIPIHRSFRTFIHRHEIPRKALHLSIGFVTLSLYSRGLSTSVIHPVLLSALVPIASVDYLRHTFPTFNRFYIRVLGALMRESEVEGYNGVIWYLLGAWAVLRFFPKDVGVMSVLLLSWCDTAASTCGRLFGRYTPRIRRGKSMAGSAAALGVGVLTAGLFWGWAVPRYGFDEGFMFKGWLRAPEVVRNMVGWTTPEEGTMGGWAALGIVGLWSGVVASASEVVDVFGWDDNFTIPVLSGLGLWGFFKVFC